MTTTRKCQDSGTQILRPVSNGTAWCGCCGQTVAAVTRPGDSNQIPHYSDHAADMATTAGRDLTAALRRYFSVGARTMRFRKGQDLHEEMVEAIELAATTPGYFVQRTEDALHPGFGAALSYRKHVAGYRVPGALAQRISEMSPWRFARLLGEMVDAGVENTGAGEAFFSSMSRSDG